MNIYKMINRPLVVVLLLGGLHAPGIILSETLHEAKEDSQIREVLNTEMRDTRLHHAKELLGSNYSHSVVRYGEAVSDINEFVYIWTERALKAEYKKYAKPIAYTILKQSAQYGFDPIFLMGVIENESSFDPTTIGSAGEIGLMQIRPTTAQWLADKLGFTFHGKKALYDPVQNIEIGAAYLSYLRDQFKRHSRDYLAAYNMGSHGVRRLIAQRERPSRYPRRVMEHYIRYYQELRKYKDTFAWNN